MFQRFNTLHQTSSSAGTVAGSCMAFMDRHLILQDDDTTDEKDVFVKKKYYVTKIWLKEIRTLISSSCLSDTETFHSL